MSDRFPVQVKPQGSMVTRPLQQRNFDVQIYTGHPISTVPEGRWNRGQLTRATSIELRPNGRNLFMHDPTDPRTWYPR